MLEKRKTDGQQPKNRVASMAIPQTLAQQGLKNVGLLSTYPREGNATNLPRDAKNRGALPYGNKVEFRPNR